MSTTTPSPAAIAPADGKLGVLVIGLGAVTTTLIAGVELAKRGQGLPIGSMTQMGTIRLGKRTDGRSPLIKDFVPLAKLEDIVWGAWDVFPDDANVSPVARGARTEICGCFTPRRSKTFERWKCDEEHQWNLEVQVDDRDSREIRNRESRTNEVYPEPAERLCYETLRSERRKKCKRERNAAEIGGYTRKARNSLSHPRWALDSHDCGGQEGSANRTEQR